MLIMYFCCPFELKSLPHLFDSWIEGRLEKKTILNILMKYIKNTVVTMYM